MALRVPLFLFLLFVSFPLHAEEMERVSFFACWPPSSSSEFPASETRASSVLGVQMYLPANWEKEPQNFRYAQFFTDSTGKRRLMVSRQMKGESTQLAALRNGFEGRHFGPPWQGDSCAEEFADLFTLPEGAVLRTYRSAIAHRGWKSFMVFYMEYEGDVIVISYEEKWRKEKDRLPFEALRKLFESVVMGPWKWGKGEHLALMP
jgi:hypothetical protein